MINMFIRTSSNIYLDMSLRHVYYISQELSRKKFNYFLKEDK